MSKKRPVVVSGDLCVIQLTQGKKSICDARFYCLVSRFNWYAHKNHRDNWYAVTNHKGRHLPLQRLILGAKSGLEIDHINGDGLDNRVANLRKCFHDENTRNTRLRCDNTSGYKGVSFDVTKGLWAARIHYKNKKYNLGTYKNKDEAARAYKKAAIELHGKFVNRCVTEYAN